VGPGNADHDREETMIAGMKTGMRLGILLLLGLTTIAGGDPFGTAEPLWSRYFETNPRAMEMYGTRAVPLGDRERCEAVREMFREAGLKEPVLEASGCVDECPGNVIAVLPGSAPGAIIVSAHLDRAGSGEGAVDDFSGVVMVAMLLGHFRDRPHKHTLIFAAFDGEERNLSGSRRFIESSANMPDEVLAFINLECLGVTFPRSWEEGSSESLEEVFVTAGKLNRIDSGPVSITGVKADSIAFLEAGYPAVTVQGIHPEDVPLLGTAWDRAGVVRTDILSVTFDALTEFIRELDELTDAPNPENNITPAIGGALSRPEEKY
jgi:hypothetical protein